MEKPTILCVPGAWHSSEIYTATIATLRQHGLHAVGLDLPSVGASPAHKTFDGDVTAIREALTQLIVAEEKEVVLVAHSYAGIPATEAPASLSRNERQQQGRKGGLIRLVYIMAVAMPEGFQAQPPGKEQYPDWMKLDNENGITTVDTKDAKNIFYNDMSSEEGEKWAAKLRPQSLGPFASITTFAAWRYVPSTFVNAPEDKTTFTQDLVQLVLQSAREQQPSAFDVVETCEGSGHCPMLSHPEWLADVLRRAAGDKNA
ncbi:MAG: hypothetical protein Q9162_001869 [Coniocarpon cinnabarinum]